MNNAPHLLRLVPVCIVAAHACGAFAADTSRVQPNPGQAGTPVGSWEGTANQNSMTYPLTVTINGSQVNVPSGTIDYRGIGCGGRVTLIKVSGGTFFYRENIERGRGKCADGGTFSLTPNSDGTADWKYLAPYNQAIAVAAAKLRRTASK